MAAYTREQAEKDKQEFIRMAAEAEARGDKMQAGVWRAEAENCVNRVGMKKAHVINLGPHSKTNPAHCIHCGKPRKKWVEGEECQPN